jgi:hypothetical protein
MRHKPRNNLRFRVAEFLVSELTLDELEDVVLSSTWNLPVDDASEANRLRREILNPIIAYKHDDISEEQMRNRLKRLVPGASNEIVLLRVGEDSLRLSTGTAITADPFRSSSFLRPVAGTRS